MALYTFVCEVCKVESDKTMKMTDAPRIGDRFVVSSSADACTCGSRVFKRVMERTPPSFRLNFRKQGL